MTAHIKLTSGVRIGEGRTFLIAEIGSNHGGDLERALATIDAAADAGADAAKFQSLCLEEQWHEPEAEIVELHRKIDLDESWYPALAEHCAKRGILFMSSPTYFRAVDLLEDVGVELYKLASAQIGTFPQIIERVGKTGKPVLLSTGIVTADELGAAVERLEGAGCSQYGILHCNSIYPTPPGKVHMPLMKEYGERFDCPVGFSDHTEGILIPVAAVAMGAKIIEKHFLLDRDFEGPDTAFSLAPNEFAEMARQIRIVEETAEPAERTQIEPEERAFKEKILQRLILKKAKRAGEAFSREDFDFRRHGEGIDCRDIDRVLGERVAGGDLEAGTLLRWEQLAESK